MSDPESETPSAPEDGKPGEDSADKKSGRVTFDSRGNAVWEWQMKTGVYGRDVDTGRMKKLEESAHLEIEDDPLATSKRQRAVIKDARVAKAGGFDPYNSDAPPRHPSTPAPAPASGAGRPQERRKPGLLKRLFGRKPR